MMDTEQLKITAGKLKGDLFCHYGFSQEIGEDTHDSGTIKSERPIHDDLRAQFQALTFHMPVIFQYLKPERLKDISDATQEVIDRFRVTEFEYDMDDNMISLSGTQSLDLGLAQITTPFIGLDGPYHFALELRTTFELLCREIKEYINGKQAPRFVQTDMFNDSETATIVDDIEKPVVEKPKRGRPKKIKPVEMTGEDAHGPFDGELKVGDGGPLNEKELSRLSEILDENEMQLTDEGHKAMRGYQPEADEEFNKPLSAFQEDHTEKGF